MYLFIHTDIDRTQESIELNELRTGERQPKRRELPAEPHHSRNRDFRDHRADVRDSRDPREHSDLRDPRNSDRQRNPRDELDLRNKYRGSQKNDWDPEDGRGGQRDLIERPLRETKIYGDERDFRDERDPKGGGGSDFRSSNRGFSLDVAAVGNFDRSGYFERDRHLPYDDRRNGRFTLPFRKNDSLNDLRDEKTYYDHGGRTYRSEHHRFPHHHSMRESRKDAHDRLDSERRGGYSDFTNKRDQPYFSSRRDYNDDMPPYNKTSNSEYFRESGDYREKIRTDVALYDSSYHHSLPRRDPSRGAPYSDRFSSAYPAKRFPPEPHSPSRSPPTHFDREGRPVGRRGRYSEMDDRYDYNDDISEGNMSDNVLPRMKLKSKVSWFAIDELMEEYIL